MTCNQLILLLQIYRGTLKNELKIGTFKDDVLFLEREGYIKTSPAFNDTHFECTPLATRWVRDELLKGPA